MVYSMKKAAGFITPPLILRKGNCGKKQAKKVPPCGSTL
jgi:hypothetical protein